MDKKYEKSIEKRRELIKKIYEVYQTEDLKSFYSDIELMLILLNHGIEQAITAWNKKLKDIIPKESSMQKILEEISEMY